MALYFPNVCCRIADQLKAIKKALSSSHHENVNAISEEVIDTLMYLHDVLNLNIPKINLLVVNSLFSFCIFPFILKELVSNDPKIALYGLSLLLLYVDHESLITPLNDLIFSENVSVEVALRSESYTEPLAYSYSFNDKTKETFEQYITRNMSDGFLCNLINDKSKYKQIVQIQKKEADFPEFNSLLQLNETMHVLLLDQMSSQEIALMNNTHKYISACLGLPVCKFDKSEQSPLEFLKKGYKGTVMNIYKQALETILLSKNDPVVLLVNIVYNVFFAKMTARPESSQAEEIVEDESEENKSKNLIPMNTREIYLITHVV